MPKRGRSPVNTLLTADDAYRLECRLAPCKYPRMIEFVDELPETATGKIPRFRLREQERAAKAAAWPWPRRHPGG